MDRVEVTNVCLGWHCTMKNSCALYFYNQARPTGYVRTFSAYPHSDYCEHYKPTEEEE